MRLPVVVAFVALTAAEIARRLKEIQAEAAKQQSTAEPWRDSDDRRQSDPWAMCDDIAACA